MRKLLFILIACLYWAGTTVQAQDYLPQDFSITVGGGVALPHVTGNRNSFFSRNGNRTGYDIMAEGRYYFLPNFAVGMQYDYLNAAHSQDKMHVHFVRPNIIFRHLWSNGNQGAFVSFGIGYMDYQERTYKQDSRNGYLYQKGYCGLSLGLGYEFRITRGFSGVLRADILTANWFVNPDGRLYNTDGYDDGIDHSWFKNNITFFNLGFAIQFGR